MGKLLSICIPTYKRKEKLSRLLANINSEAGGLEGDIEVCVSDNGSDDRTQELLNDWKPKFEKKVFLSEKNNGFDINLLRALGLGTGKYLWMLGDDDGIVKGSLKKLVSFLKELKNDEVKVVYLTVTQRASAESPLAISPSQNTSNHHLVTSPMAFMSAIILRKDAFDSIDKKAVEKGIGTLYIHCWFLRLIGLKHPNWKAVFYETPVCIAEPSDIRFAGPKEESPGEYARLTRELRYSKSMMLTYFRFLRLNMSSGSFVKYLFFFAKKAVSSLSFPFFEILCERVFRGNRSERLALNYLLELFGLLGVPLYAHYLLVRTLPGFLADALLRATLLIARILRLTPETGYGFWKEFWLKNFPACGS